MPPKLWNESFIAIISSILPIVSCPFRKKWEAGVWNQGTFRILIWVLAISYVEIVLEATISTVFSYLDVCVTLKDIFYENHVGTLDSWSREENEKENTQNNVIEVEIKTLSM